MEPLAIYEALMSLIADYLRALDQIMADSAMRKTTAVQFKNTTHSINKELIAIVTNEGVLYSELLAKYFAAFFRMWRSSVTLINSDLSRLFLLDHR